MLRRLVRGLLAVMGILFLAAVAAFLVLCWQINRTGSSDEAQPADVIVILGARVEADGQAGPDLRVRTLHAVSLYRQGLAPYLICTGGYQDDRLSAAAVACKLAVSEGVPQERALLADGSMTTGEDAVSTRDLVLAHGWRTAILVSHPLHLERARILFEEQGITVYSSPTSTDLAAIPLETRAWLTLREAVGIVWIGLEKVGVPYDWTIRLSKWVYGAAVSPDEEYGLAPPN
ncbi:MAG: YdcF family protein [Anaerolineae bacterium]|nr:YdcF family protein [Anaerolineae bacterium]